MYPSVAIIIFNLLYKTLRYIAKLQTWNKTKQIEIFFSNDRWAWYGRDDPTNVASNIIPGLQTDLILLTESLCLLVTPDCYYWPRWTAQDTDIHVWYDRSMLSCEKVWSFPHALASKWPTLLFIDTLPVCHLAVRGRRHGTETGCRESGW